jgi:hypothetical protein
MCGSIIGFLVLLVVLFIAFKVGEAFLKIGCGLFVAVVVLGLLAKACN